MRSFVKNTQGFSLIELLVGMTIVAMLMFGMLQINQSNAERSRRELFQSDIETMLSYFRSARTSAITNTQVNGEVPNAFGIYLEKNDDENSLELVFFADNNDAAGTGEGDNQFNEENDTIIKTKTMSRIWSIGFLNPNPGTVTLDTTLNTLFYPPNSTMAINDNDSDNDLVSAEIVGTYKSTSKRVCLNRVSQFFEILTGESCS